MSTAAPTTEQRLAAVEHQLEQLAGRPDLSPTVADLSAELDALGTAAGAGFIAPVLPLREVPTKVWNAAQFPGATDTAKLKEAIAEAKAAGHCMVWLGGKGFWVTTETVVVPPGARVEGQQFGLGTKVEATGAYFIWTLGEAGDASEITIAYMHLRAKEAQAAGGGFGWATPGTIFHIHDIRFGSNLKFGVNMSGFTISAAWLENLAWNDGATQVKSCGTAIKLGDGAHLVNQIRLRYCECVAATTADMEVGLDLEFVDTITVTDSIFEVVTAGIRSGATEGGGTSTGLRFTNVATDTCSSHGWSLHKYRDVVLTGCNSQTCGTKLAGFGMYIRFGQGFRMIGGTVQHNQNHGIVFEAATNFSMDGVDVTDNNQSNEGGSGVVIAAGSEIFKIARCQCGNFYIGLAGHQQFGILIETAGAKDFQVTDNTLNGNTAGPIESLATGANQMIRRNMTKGGTRAWAAKVKRKTAEAITANKNGDTLVMLTVETAAVTRTLLEVLVGGVLIATPEISAAATGKSFVTLSFEVPTFLTYEVKVKEGAVEPAGEFETSYKAL
jgi:hypothetical protein